MLRRNVFIVLVGAQIFVSCADSDRRGIESRGTLVQDGEGVRLVESASEAQEICDQKGTRCEPNYIYYADFGLFRRRPDPSPPSPLPPAPPVVTPAPTPGPVPGQEFLDYSRAIMNVRDAWAITPGSRDIIVAVVDTGVDIHHPDLVDNLWVNEKERDGLPGVDDDRNGYVDDVYGWDFVHGRPNAIDDNKHGTHCSGIIGAAMNGFGTVGVAQQVRIMPLKFLGSDGSGDTNAAIQAIDYAVANGAKVISNSWGGGGASTFLNDAIQRAVAKGIFVVAAAGNETNNNDVRASYPASYPNVISVASTDSDDALSSFSNYGVSSVTIAAPGSRIYSTVPGGGWDLLSGTSMATPQVSGALALALSSSRGLTSNQIRSLLCSTSRKILTNRVQCGRMDVGAFIKSVAN